MRARDAESGGYSSLHRSGAMLVHPGVELPPGASFDPNPQKDCSADPMEPSEDTGTLPRHGN